MEGPGKFVLGRRPDHQAAAGRATLRREQLHQLHTE